MNGYLTGDLVKQVHLLFPLSIEKKVALRPIIGMGPKSALLITIAVQG